MDFESTVSAIPPRAHMPLTCLFLFELGPSWCRPGEVLLNYRPSTERDRGTDHHEELAGFRAQRQSVAQAFGGPGRTWGAAPSALRQGERSAQVSLFQDRSMTFSPGKPRPIVPTAQQEVAEGHARPFNWLKSPSETPPGSGLGTRDHSWPVQWRMSSTS